MQRLFRTKGRLFCLEDAEGQPVSGRLAEGRPVLVDVKYELKPSAHQPLRVEIYGPNLWGMGQTRERLALENGVLLTGRTYGGGLGGNRGEVRRMRLLDIEESKIELHPTKATLAPLVLDAAILGVVSSHPLGYGACANGVARPGFPFSFRTNYPKELKGSWSSAALQLHYEHYEIVLAGSSNYWRRFVDTEALQHNAIIGVRRLDRAALDWDEINRVASLLSNFLGWINHCVSPVFHIKGYRRGKVVYKAYNLHPHPTVRRDEFSWLPMFGPKNRCGSHGDILQGLLDGFANACTKNEREKGVFYIALDMLRSRSKGSPRHRPTLGYLRDTFGACGILISILIGPNSSRGRRDVIWRCLKEIDVKDELPLKDRNERDWIVKNHPELWWAVKSGKIAEDEKGTLSRPLANVENWLLHMDDPRNARMLLGLPVSVQQYLVEVSTWLADLLVLKVVGYQGWDFNRLAGETEIVPWAKCRRILTAV